MKVPRNRILLHKFRIIFSSIIRKLSSPTTPQAILTNLSIEFKRELRYCWFRFSWIAHLSTRVTDAVMRQGYLHPMQKLSEDRRRGWTLDPMIRRSRERSARFSLLCYERCVDRKTAIEIRWKPDVVLPYDVNREKTVEKHRFFLHHHRRFNTTVSRWANWWSIRSHLIDKPQGICQFPWIREPSIKYLIRLDWCDHKTNCYCHAYTSISLSSMIRNTSEYFTLTQSKRLQSMCIRHLIDAFSFERMCSCSNLLDAIKYKEKITKTTFVLFE